MKFKLAINLDWKLKEIYHQSSEIWEKPSRGKNKRKESKGFHKAQLFMTGYDKEYRIFLTLIWLREDSLSLPGG